MPELPDVVVYLERIEAFVGGTGIEAVRVSSPFVVRSYDPPIREVEGQRVVGTRRIGKRLVLVLTDDLYLVIHLMIAGRLRWKPPKAPVPRKLGLLALDFASGTLLLTEAGTKRRASVHLVRGAEALGAFDRGGVEPLEVDEATFVAVLRRENRTLKRALTDPRLLSGIGNAYSDEILHRAGLSPVKRTGQLDDDEATRLFVATRRVLGEWVDVLRREVGSGFPDKVTAFKAGMAAHGRYGEPCPVCDTRIQRIRYETNEVNYCPRCQTGGKVLADRSLSRLLKGDWPRSIEELEQLEERRSNKETRTR